MRRRSLSHLRRPWRDRRKCGMKHFLHGSLLPVLVLSPRPRVVIIVMLLGILGAVVTTLGGTEEMPPSFTIIDVPRASSTYTSGINHSGQIVGEFQDSKDQIHGFLRKPAGDLTILEVGVISTHARGINSAGTTVGYYTDEFHVHSFLRSLTGALTRLDVPGALDTYASGINDAGYIVGWFNSRSGVHGFARTPTGIFSIVDVRRGDITLAYGINNRGEIVGTFREVEGMKEHWHGFLRTTTGAFTVLDAPGAINTNAAGADDAGRIVGSFLDTAYREHGFIRSATGTFVTIDVPGAIASSDVSAINPTGRMVGEVDGRHGFVTSATRSAMIAHLLNTMGLFTEGWLRVIFEKLSRLQDALGPSG